MVADLLLQTLVRAEVHVAAAVLIVLALRPVARRLLGADLAYGLWTLVPIAGVTSLFPTLHDFSARPVYKAVPALSSPHSSLLLAIYLLGMVGMLVLFAAGERRFRMLASQGRAGPAIMGLSWPRLVTPTDYETRFEAAERRLIREHERTHIERRHPRDNVVIAAIQMLAWCNPLVHVAARFARLDQELACDARVMERLPTQRGLYGRVLLKAHGVSPPSVFACALVGAGQHPLEVRLRSLRRAPLSVRQYVAGGAVLAVLALSTALALWAVSPASARGGLPVAAVAPFN
jgi:beta-lactamase regulating signal transducer with metallopeptidase domain